MKILKKIALGASTALLASTAMPLLAQDREAPPEPTEARPFALPELTEFELSNGIDVTLVPYGKTPQVTILASVQTGNIDEGENVWLADLTGDMMEKGAGGRDASQIAEMAANMGGGLSLGVGADQVTAYTGVLSEHAANAVRLIADVLVRPDFPAAELDKVKADMLRNLSVAKSTPSGMAQEAFAGVMYPDHPYGRFFPTQEQVTGYTLDQVRAFHAENFGAERTRVYVVGQFDEAAVRAALEESFGNWKAGKPATELASPPVDGKDVVLVDRPGAPQSTLRIGQRVDVPMDDIEFDAANTLLGGYFSSRITRNIREDKGYTYSPGSSLSQNVHGSGWAEYADVTAEATGPSIVEILKEVRRMQAEPPTDAELQGIKNYMNGTFVIGLASRNGVASQLASLDILGLGPDYLNTYVERVSALTGADLQRATAENLAIDDMTYVVVGPLETVRPQLEAVPELSGRLPE